MHRSILTIVSYYASYPRIHTFIASFAYGLLRRFLPEEKVESVRGLALTIDKRCAVFDVAADDLDTFLAGMICLSFMLFSSIDDNLTHLQIYVLISVIFYLSVVILKNQLKENESHGSNGARRV